MKLLRLLALIPLLASFGPGPLTADEWPQWRGPHFNGTSHETNLPTKVSKEENLAWRIELPGPAGSTPAIWGDRIYVSSADGKDVVLLAISRAGKILWKQVVDTGLKDFRGDEGNSAAPSPMTDGRRVWLFTGTGKLVCFDKEGVLVWKKDLAKTYGEYDHWHGMSSTPLLVDGVLYHMRLQIEKPFLIAVDAKTGQVKWKQARESDAEHESRHSYASPVLYEDGEKRLLLIHGADYLSAHELKDGREVWRVGGLNPQKPGANYNRFLRFVSSPACAPGLVVVPSAKNGPTLAVKPDGKGDITKSGLLWKQKDNTTDVPTPLIHDGLVYLMREKHVLICIDAKTGQEVYKERVHGDVQRASPVYADGKIYIASRRGKLFVVKPGRKFEILAENDLGEPIAATPAPAGGRLYVRTYKALWAFENRATAKR